MNTDDFPFIEVRGQAESPVTEPVGAKTESAANRRAPFPAFAAASGGDDGRRDQEPQPEEPVDDLLAALASGGARPTRDSGSGGDVPADRTGAGSPPERPGQPAVGADPEAHADGAAASRAQLDRYGVFGNHDWRDAAIYRDLDDPQQRAVDREVFKTLYLLAASSLWQAAATPSGDRREAFLTAAQAYNAKAAELVDDTTPDLAAVTRRQSTVIKQWRNGHARPLMELFEDRTATSDQETLGNKAISKRSLRRSITLFVGLARQGAGRIRRLGCYLALFTQVSVILVKPKPLYHLYPFAAAICREFLSTRIARHEQQKYGAGAVDDFNHYMKLKGASSAAAINRALAWSRTG